MPLAIREHTIESMFLRDQFAWWSEGEVIDIDLFSLDIKFFLLKLLSQYFSV
jgi:hypothetical protein